MPRCAPRGRVGSDQRRRPWAYECPPWIDPRETIRRSLRIQRAMLPVGNVEPVALPISLRQGPTSCSPRAIWKICPWASQPGVVEAPRPSLGAKASGRPRRIGKQYGNVGIFDQKWLAQELLLKPTKPCVRWKFACHLKTTGPDNDHCAPRILTSLGDQPSPEIPRLAAVCEAGKLFLAHRSICAGQRAHPAIMRAGPRSL